MSNLEEKRKEREIKNKKTTYIAIIIGLPVTLFLCYDIGTYNDVTVISLIGFVITILLTLYFRFFYKL